MNNSSSETIKNSLENKRIQGSLLKNEDVQLNEKLKRIGNTISPIVRDGKGRYSATC